MTTEHALREARARDHHWIDVILATVERQPDGCLTGRCSKCHGPVSKSSDSIAAHWRHEPLR